MANQAWRDLVNGITEAEMGSITTFDDLDTFLRQQGIKSNGKSSDRYYNGMIVKSIGKSSSTSGSTSTDSSVVVNVDMDATRTGTSKITVRTFTARSRKTDDTQVKSGILYYSAPAVVASVAAMCGYSIGWQIASGIVRWLVQEGFDWGSSCVMTSLGVPQPMLLGVPTNDGVDTYMEYNLFVRLVNKLKEWGLWNIDPSSYIPYEPVIGTTTNYDFRGRFPNIPDKYVEPMEQLINEMINARDPGVTPDPVINPDVNQYYIVTITREESLQLTILQAHELNFTFRNTLVNTDGYFVGGEDIDADNNKIVTVRSPFEEGAYYRFIIEKDGDMKARPKQILGIFGTTFYYNADPDVTGVCFDNFGTYRSIQYSLDDGLIHLGPPTDDLGQVVIDPNASDISTVPINRPDTPEHPNPMYDVWERRLLVSTPDLDQPFFDFPMTSPLNEREEYISIEIVGRDIDATLTQARVKLGHTGDDLTEQAIRETPSIAPRIGIESNPTPTNPPSDNPALPTLPSGLNTTGIIQLYKLDDTNLKNFRNWLWDPNFFDNIVKMFQSPMDAVIGCHAIFATPENYASNPTNVVCGNLVADGTIGTSVAVSGTIIKQYKMLSCGHIHIEPKNHNINDIIATKIQLFLPFIGFVDIATTDVFYKNSMDVLTGRYLWVDYAIDFLTGACAAFISLSETAEQSNKKILYNFSGNCAVEIPLSSANYDGILRNTLMAAASYGAVVEGLSATPTTVAAISDIPDVITPDTFATSDVMTDEGAVRQINAQKGKAGIEKASNAVVTSQLHITRSGSCGANIGAMSPRKPYLVINRNVSYDADDRRKFEGLPQNRTVRLGAMNGYTRVKNINLENLDCTESEKKSILNLLESGVFV